MILEDHASDRSAPRGKDRDRRTAKVYLVGGGIASLAAAAFMIRDGDVPGHNITILEELDNLGGSLDGSGSPQNGYVLRGGRMLESKYLCTYELFWFMWCTTFAFQPWHSAVEFKRYLVRFSHMVAGFDRLQGIMRTVYNQYDSMVRPLQKWLDERGVRFELNTRVTDFALREQDGEMTVTQLAYQRDGIASEIAVGAGDYVLVTLEHFPFRLHRIRQRRSNFGIRLA
jgi:myosin-crossreactive antigen